MNGGRFRTDAGTKAAFSQETVISGNGERARSLLCGREALDKPSGAADSLLNADYLSAFVKEKRRFTCLKILQKAHRQVTLTTAVTGHPRQETSPEEAEVMHHHAQNLVMVRPRGDRGFKSQLQAQEKTFRFRGKHFQMTSFGSACPVLHRSKWCHSLPLCESCPRSEQQRNFVPTKSRVSGGA